MSELKPGWTRVKFGEVVRLVSERCADPLSEGIERYIGLEHLEPGELRVRSWGDVADGVTFTSRVRPGQVLFGKRRAYQRKVAVADFDAVCSGDIYLFESADAQRLLPALLPFVCQTDSFFEHAVGTSAGSLSPRTNWASLASYEFALPPSEEQHRIAGTIGRLAQLETSLTLAEHAADSLCEAAAKEFFQVDGRSQASQTLASLCDEITVGIVVKPAQWYVPAGDGIPALIMKNVRRGSLNLEELVNISPAGHALHSKSRLVAGDIVAVRSSGSIDRTGDAAVIPSALEGSNCIDLLILRPRKGVSSQYLCEFLNAPTTRGQLIGRSSGTMQKHLNVGALRSLPVPATSTSVQEEIVEQLRQLASASLLLKSRRSDLLPARRELLNNLSLGSIR